MGTDARTGKLIARRLAHLPSGTVSFESVGEERLLGKVDCEPQMRMGDAPKLKVGGGGGGGGDGEEVSRDEVEHDGEEVLCMVCRWEGT